MKTHRGGLQGVLAKALRPMIWLGRHELATLVVLALAAGGVWAFVELADEVVEGRTRPLDETILLAMRNPENHADPIGPKWFEELARDFTSLGGFGVLAALTVAVAGYLFLDGKVHAMAFVLGAIVGGWALGALLKVGFDRARPDIVPYGAYASGASFPSGHSMMSAVTYLTLGALLARIQRRLALRAYFLGLAVLSTLVVGLSRVYLGVHWPTDVLGGWTAGATWALLCWLAARWLQRSGRVEADDPS